MPSHPQTNSIPLGIYHADCLDGFASAWVLHEALGPDGVEPFEGVYGHPPPDVTGRDVILVDFSYPREQLLEMAASARSILILDHHISAQKALVDLPPNVEAHFDMDRCGAAITWAHYFPDRPAPTLLNHIEDRDLWRFSLTGTREIIAAVASYPFEMTVWKKLMHMDPMALVEEGIPILRQQRKIVQQQVRSMAYHTTLGGYPIIAVNTTPHLASDVAAALSPGQPFVACYWDVPEGRKVSLRSAPDGLDVSVIAAQYGGGGHVHAAGFFIPKVPDPFAAIS